jgi:hypothetical protein
MLGQRAVELNAASTAPKRPASEHLKEGPDDRTLPRGPDIFRTTLGTR